jgi:hypothetical protein
MDSGIIVALALAAIFFGAIAWLVIHARRQERQAVPATPEADVDIRPEGLARSTRQPSLHVAARAVGGTRRERPR